MIEKLFATHILVKDLEISTEDSAEIIALTKGMIEQYKAETSMTVKQIGEDSLPFFTTENLTKFPVLETLRQHFIDGFWELAKSYENNSFTRELIEEMVCSYTGRLPIMQKGDFKHAHNHPGASSFAILYMSDIDNKKHGGELIIHDPTWSSNVGYTNNQNYKVETKKHRLVVAPGNVWHSVTAYTGDEDRIAIVFNLDITPLDKFYANEK